MLLFWGGKGINNSANIFAFAVKNDKSTRKKSEKPRQYSRHRLPLQEIKSVSADRIEYTQAFLPVYRHPPPCLSGTCLNARPFCYIDSRYVQSASYLKLHNLTLGYTIGKSQLSVLCKQSLSLLTHLHFWRKCDVIKVITYCLVCEMPRNGDCGSARIAVPLQRDYITLRSQAAPRQRASSLRSVCTDLVTR